MKTHPHTSRIQALLWGCAVLASFQLTAGGATLTNRYSFNVDGDASDSVGGQHGTLVNAVVADGQAQLFSPFATPSSDIVNGQYVELPPDLLTNYTAVTIEAWVTPTHDDITGGAFWNRIWDFGNSDGVVGTHSFWFRGGNSTTPIRGDIFYPGGGDAIEGGLIPNGVETHIVWTSDAMSQRARIYVNGVRTGVNDAFDSNPAAMGSTTNNWLARSQFTADTFWMGSINEFRIYEGELDPLTVAASYAAGPDDLGGDAGTVTGLVVQVSSPLTVGSAADAAVLAGADGLTSPVNIVNSSLDIDFTSGNPAILTVDSRGVVSGVGAGTANVIASFGGFSATQSVTVVAVPTTMKHRYSFAADASDSIGDQHGTLWGNAAIVNGQVVLDGVIGSYVDLPANLISAANIANKAVTIEAWATFNAGQGAWTRLFDFGNIAGVNGGNYLFMTPSGAGQARAVVSDTSPGFQGESIAGTAPILGRTNVHVGVVYNPNPGRSIIALYLDGVLAASTTTTRPFSGILNNFSFLGRALYAGDPWLAGAIDEFRIYDGELDRFQLAASAQSGPDNPNFNPGTFQSFVLSAGNDANLSLNQVRQLQAVLNFSAATNINVLGDASLTLTSSDTNVLTITSPGGTMTANRIGSATVTATYQRIVDTTTNTYQQTLNVNVVVPPVSLVHRYSFNEGSGDTVFDLVGTAHGKLASGTNELGVTNATWAAGQLILNTNVELAATDAYVNLPAGIISALGTNATFEVWTTVSVGGSWARVFDFGSVPASPTNAAEPNVFLSRGAGNTTPRYDWVNGNINATNVWNNGETAHFVVTHSGKDGAARLYRNGIPVASSAGQNLPLNTVNDIYNFIGRSIYSWPISLPGGFFDPYFVGSFDEFRIYQGLLTAAEIAQNTAIGPNQLIGNVPLSVSVSGGNLTLSWPTYAPRYALESTTSLTSPSWAPVVGTLTQTASTFQMTVPIGPGNVFFRLKQ